MYFSEVGETSVSTAGVAGCDDTVKPSTGFTEGELQLEGDSDEDDDKDVTLPSSESGDHNMK